MFNSFSRVAPWVILGGAVVLLAGLLWAASALVGSDDQETSRAGDDIRQVSADEQDHAGDHGGGSQGSGTAAEQEAADELFGDTEAGVARFEDLEAARTAGYEPLGGEQSGPGRPVHFVNREYFEDGKVLDPERPESLVYAENRDGGMDLIGVMYIAPRGEGPAVGGELTQWHTHDDLCVGLDEAGNAAMSTKDGECPEGSLDLSELEMLHVWLFDHPDGPFSPEIVPVNA